MSRHYGQWIGEPEDAELDTWTARDFQEMQAERADLTEKEREIDEHYRELRL